MLPATMDVIDSDSVGDPARHLSFEEVAARLAALPPSPRDRGRLAFLVCRGERGVRSTPDRVRLTPEDGMPGDAWGRKPKRNPEAQLAVMQLGVASTLANG